MGSSCSCASCVRVVAHASSSKLDPTWTTASRLQMCTRLGTRWPGRCGLCPVVVLTADQIYHLSIAYSWYSVLTRARACATAGTVAQALTLTSPVSTDRGTGFRLGPERGTVCSGCIPFLFVPAARRTVKYVAAAQLYSCQLYTGQYSCSGGGIAIYRVRLRAGASHGASAAGASSHVLHVASLQYCVV